MKYLTVKLSIFNMVLFGGPWGEHDNKKQTQMSCTTWLTIQGNFFIIENSVKYMIIHKTYTTFLRGCYIFPHIMLLQSSFNMTMAKLRKKLIPIDAHKIHKLKHTMVVSYAYVIHPLLVVSLCLCVRN